MRLSVLCKTVSVFVLMLGTTAVGQTTAAPWTRHSIDASSRGADGIRIADVNGDTHPDFVTGWEEGGQIRVVVNPGPENAKKQWRSILVGKVAKPEDAVFVDLDADGAIDVVSSCEGKTRQIYVHWSPKDRSDLFSSKKWKTETLPAAKDKTMWMFCLPLQVDGQNGVDLIAGAKGSDAKIGWFQAPANSRKLDQWKWHSIYRAGWIMSLYARDVDGDGDQDVITTDRKGERRGCHWLENPGAGIDQRNPWKVHSINTDHEAMFATLGDLDQDGMEDILTCAKRPEKIYYYRRTQMHPPKWDTHVINWPVDNKSDKSNGIVGGAKAVEVGDVDGDGDNDLVCTCESATSALSVFDFWIEGF